MTEKGGIAYNMMADKSKTLSGLWSTIVDRFQNAEYVFGQVAVTTTGLTRSMKGLINALGKFRVWFPIFAKLHPIFTRFAIIFSSK